MHACHLCDHVHACHRFVLICPSTRGRIAYNNPHENITIHAVDHARVAATEAAIERAESVLSQVWALSKGGASAASEGHVESMSGSILTEHNSPSTDYKSTEHRESTSVSMVTEDDPPSCTSKDAELHRTPTPCILCGGFDSVSNVLSNYTEPKTLEKYFWAHRDCGTGTPFVRGWILYAYYRVGSKKHAKLPKGTQLKGSGIVDVQTGAFLCDFNKLSLSPGKKQLTPVEFFLHKQ